MIRINLLPHELRKKKKVPFLDRTLFYGIIVLVGELIFLYLISIAQQTKIAELESQIAGAQLELDRYQDKIRMLEEANRLRDELTNRLNAVQELESKRAVWVQLISDIAMIVPEYLWLDRIEERSGGALYFEGKSYTLKAIASFLINAMTSPAFANAEIGPIQKIGLGNYSGYSFSLTVNSAGAQSTQPGTFSIDTTKANLAQKKGYSGFVSSSRSKLGLYTKEEAKKMFQGVNQ